MHTKPHTVLKLEPYRDDSDNVSDHVLVICDDGSAYTFTVGHSDEWYALPPIPGTKASAEATAAK